jgi:hypothetical protein
MAKLIIVIVLNYTQVYNAFIRQSLLVYYSKYSRGRRSRRSRRSTNRHYLRSLYKGLSRRRAKGYSIIFRALLLFSSYSNLLINSYIVLYKGS